MSRRGGVEIVTIPREGQRQWIPHCVRFDLPWMCEVPIGHDIGYVKWDIEHFLYIQVIFAQMTHERFPIAHLYGVSLSEPVLTWFTDAYMQH